MSGLGDTSHGNTGNETAHRESVGQLVGAQRFGGGVGGGGGRSTSAGELEDVASLKDSAGQVGLAQSATSFSSRRASLLSPILTPTAVGGGIGESIRENILSPKLFPTRWPSVGVGKALGGGLGALGGGLGKLGGGLGALGGGLWQLGRSASTGTGEFVDLPSLKLKDDTQDDEGARARGGGGVREICRLQDQPTRSGICICNGICILQIRVARQKFSKGSSVVSLRGMCSRALTFETFFCIRDGRATINIAVLCEGTNAQKSAPSYFHRVNSLQNMFLAGKRSTLEAKETYSTSV